MNRHHPYGGGPYDGPRRGGGGNFGPGPDRSHHYDRGGAPRGRGFGRGRGRGGGQNNYGGYGNPGSYDQGPPQGDMGGYNNYQSGPPQGQYFQNGNYNAPGPGQYSDPSGGYDQGYGYEGTLESRLSFKSFSWHERFVELVAPRLSAPLPPWILDPPRGGIRFSIGHSGSSGLCRDRPSDFTGSHRHHRKSLVSTSLRIFGALSCLENGALCNILQRRFAVVDLEPDLSFSRILIA